MRIQYISDLHIECQQFFVEKKGDVLILAGDIFSGKSVVRFRDFMKRTLDLGFDAVLYVLGNHEGYGWSIGEAKDLLREYDSNDSTFWFLDRSGVVLNGQRFTGASLWSNPTQNAKIQARLYINDYRAIRNWNIDRHVDEHYRDLEYLEGEIAEGDVVITHFPPRYTGIDQARFGGDTLNSWFTNNLDGLICEKKPALWVSGHTHHCWKSKIGSTMDVGNCRGYTYIHRGTGQAYSEVKAFDPLKTIRIGALDEGADDSSEGAA